MAAGETSIKNDSVFNIEPSGPCRLPRRLFISQICHLWLSSGGSDMAQLKGQELKKSNVRALSTQSALLKGLSHSMLQAEKEFSSSG